MMTNKIIPPYSDLRSQEDIRKYCESNMRSLTRARMVTIGPWITTKSIPEEWLPATKGYQQKSLNNCK